MNPWMWLLFVLAAAVVAAIVIALAASVIQQVRKGSARVTGTHLHWTSREDDGREPNYR
jgi:hypothetical protein